MQKGILEKDGRQTIVYKKQLPIESIEGVDMENLQIEESLGETTAGLTSASQLINITDAVSYELANTSSDIPEPLFETPRLPQPTEGLPLSAGEIFRRALRHSFRRESKILNILAKY
jgi:hypothetical protein